MRNDARVVVLTGTASSGATLPNPTGSTLSTVMAASLLADVRVPATATTITKREHQRSPPVGTRRVLRSDGH